MHHFEPSARPLAWKMISLVCALSQCEVGIVPQLSSAVVELKYGKVKPNACSYPPETHKSRHSWLMRSIISLEGGPRLQKYYCQRWQTACDVLPYRPGWSKSPVFRCDQVRWGNFYRDCEHWRTVFALVKWPNGHMDLSWFYAMTTTHWCHRNVILCRRW